VFSSLSFTKTTLYPSISMIPSSDWKSLEGLVPLELHPAAPRIFHDLLDAGDLEVRLGIAGGSGGFSGIDQQPSPFSALVPQAG
jgi:hypothetical protein